MDEGYKSISQLVSDAIKASCQMYIKHTVKVSGFIKFSLENSSCFYLDVNENSSYKGLKHIYESTTCVNKVEDTDTKNLSRNQQGMPRRKPEHEVIKPNLQMKTPITRRQDDKLDLIPSDANLGRRLRKRSMSQSSPASKVTPVQKMAKVTTLEKSTVSRRVRTRNQEVVKKSEEKPAGFSLVNSKSALPKYEQEIQNILICDICMQTFSSKCYLTRHKSVKHQQPTKARKAKQVPLPQSTQAPKRSIKKPTAVEKAYWNCNFCHRAFHARHNLHKHQVTCNKKPTNRSSRRKLASGNIKMPKGFSGAIKPTLCLSRVLVAKPKQKIPDIKITFYHEDAIDDVPLVNFKPPTVSDFTDCSNESDAVIKVDYFDCSSKGDEIKYNGLEKADTTNGRVEANETEVGVDKEKEENLTEDKEETDITEEDLVKEKKQGLPTDDGQHEDEDEEIRDQIAAAGPDEKAEDPMECGNAKDQDDINSIETKPDNPLANETNQGVASVTNDGIATNDVETATHEDEDEMVKDDSKVDSDPLKPNDDTQGSAEQGQGNEQSDALSSKDSNVLEQISDGPTIPISMPMSTGEATPDNDTACTSSNEDKCTSVDNAIIVTGPDPDPAFDTVDPNEILNVKANMNHIVDVIKDDNDGDSSENEIFVTLNEVTDDNVTD